MSECSVYSCVYSYVVIEKRIERQAKSQHWRTPKHNIVRLRPRSPRISALEIQEWIHAVLRIPEQNVNMIQIDGTKRQVYIKMTDIEGVQDIKQGTCGQAEYKHTNGEISTVRVNMAV